MENCGFCSEWKGQNEKIKKLGLKSSVLYEGKDWFVVPAIGCFMRGYLLVIHKEHYPSIALCPESSYAELEEILLLFKNVLYKTYGKKVISFEHGATKTQVYSANSVDHVHLHLLPAEVELSTFVSTPSYAFSSFLELKADITERQKPYLFFETIQGERRYTEYDERVHSSQYFRRAVVQALQSDVNWNWRENEYEEIFIKTYLEVKESLEKFSGETF